MWLIIVQFWQSDKIHVTLYLNRFTFVRVQVEFWERLRQHPLIGRGYCSAAPKEQMPLNLSGKRARIREQSGEWLAPM